MSREPTDALERAQAFYHSPTYAATKALRAGGGSASLVAIDGYPIEAWEATARESAELSLPA